MEIPFYRYENQLAEHSNVSDVLDAEELGQVTLLEEEFRSYVGCDDALATSSGTAALHLAMLALDLKRGDKIVCSVNTHPAVPEVVRHFDAEPVFIDIDEKNFHIDLEKLEAYLETNVNKKLKAIVVTLVGGVTIDLERIYEMASKFNVKVVLDAAEALGCEYNGKKIGNIYADITCFDFSSHLKKNIANGGMIVSNDSAIMERARLLANHGITRSSEALEYIYDVVDIGNDYMMDQLSAAYFRARIARIDSDIARQKEIAAIYNEELQGVEHVSIPTIASDDFSYHLYMIKIDKNRDSFALDLQKEGIKTGLHYIPLHLLSYYKTKYELRINDYPVALRYYQQILSLPIYAAMSDDEVYYVCETIKKIAKTKV